MKLKRLLSLFIAVVLCLSSFSVFGEKYADRIDVYYNEEIISFDVEPVIENGRALVPLRAISEAFDCEVYWYGDSKTIDIYSPVNAYIVSAERLAETITDDEGNVLIETVAYYPAIENPTDIPCLNKINFDYKWNAEKFIEEARAKKEDARALRTEMGEDAFTPFVYELTFEQTYNIWGNISFTKRKQKI